MFSELDTDTRYLEETDLLNRVEFGCWALTGNPFERRLAANLRAGTAAILDWPTLWRVLGTAAATRDRTIFLKIDLHEINGIKHARAFVLGVRRAVMPPITADDAGNLLPALTWYARNQPSLVLAVSPDSLFWVMHGRGTDFV